MVNAINASHSGAHDLAAAGVRVAQLSDRRDIASPKTVSEVRVGGTVQFRDKRGELHTIVVDAMLGALVTGRELQRSGSPGLTRWHLHLSFLTKGH